MIACIRAPFKDSGQRDVLRVKGGSTDYYVIGEIDVQALRQLQSSDRSPRETVQTDAGWI